MLNANLTEQLRNHFQNIQHPITLVATLDEGAKSRELKGLLETLAGLSDAIGLSLDGTATRRPSFAIVRDGAPEVSVSFAGIPMGHEFTSLVLGILQVGGHPAKEAAELLDRAAGLKGPLHFETFFSLSCQNCPDVVQALNLMSVLNPEITHEAIDGALFQDEVEARGVMAVPSVFLNGEHFASGRMSLADIVDRLAPADAEEEAKALSEREPLDVLIVGGGPAGAAAAVYAARKGVKTGIVTERFGGQVGDTMGIENLVSVPYTEGPKLVAAMERHVTDHDVDIFASKRAARIVPATEPGGLISVELEGGGVLRTKSAILSTGARWRTLGVPGEDAYRNKGVAYCPHCDGPLFKGKRVAVVGGGNSGVEAAIDLAGLASHVTVLEFADTLRADQVLQDKLDSLPNVTVIRSARTTEVLGDGSKVTGLRYEDRSTGALQALELEGIFVQIGLQPNTEWLKGSVELSQHHEIVVDDRGRTSVPGVFAAGDCTTVPYKQIVISMGQGATAALSAFDHLIRS